MSPALILDVDFAGDDSFRNGYAISVERRVKGYELVHTEDGGVTWQTVNVPLFDFYQTVQLVVRDSLTTWFAPHSFFNGGVRRTTDAGRTWQISQTDAEFYALSYFDSSNTLIAGGNKVIRDGKMIVRVSTDLGSTWQQTLSGTYANPIGLMFSDTKRGVLGALHYTVDGGLTWTSSSGYSAGGLQPAAIPGTGHFFNMDHNVFLKSYDGGRSWQPDFNVFVAGLQFGGTLRWMNGALFMQSTSIGILASIDSGKSWRQICGPSTSDRSRFYVGRGRIYAGDTAGGIWLNTSGMGSDSKPVVPHVVSINIGCKPASVPIPYYFEGCGGMYVEGLSVSSTELQIRGSRTMPYQVNAEDTLWLTAPSNATRGKAYVKLKYGIGIRSFDTTIEVVIGDDSPAAERLKLIPSSPTGKVGEPVTLALNADHQIEHKNLNSIEFELRYNSDLLTQSGSNTSVTGATLTTGAISINGREATLPITLTGSNMTLDANVALASIEFIPTLTSATSTPIIIQNLKLNGGDVQYERCTLTATADTVSFHLQLDCGDETIRRHMLGRLPFTIVSVTPNPTSGIIEAVVRGGPGLSYDVLDLVGKTMTSGKMDGEHLTIDLSSYGSGSYYLRFAGMGRVETRRVVVGR